MKSRILLVEDEPHLAEGICDNLEAEGYEVQHAKHGEEGWLLYQQHSFDLLILDVMLPKLDGFALCERIRARGGKEPILFLTARAHLDDKVHGLQVGGDDYLAKPFHLNELLVRISAMLRRQSWYQQTQPDFIEIGACRVCFQTFEIIDAAGQIEMMSQKEILILKLLYEKKGQVVSRDDILNQVWGYDVFPSSRTVDNFIVRLRKKIEINPAIPVHLHTIRGIGYQLT